MACVSEIIFGYVIFSSPFRQMEEIFKILQFPKFEIFTVVTMKIICSRNVKSLTL